MHLYDKLSNLLLFSAVKFLIEKLRLLHFYIDKVSCRDVFAKDLCMHNNLRDETRSSRWHIEYLMSTSGRVLGRDNGKKLMMRSMEKVRDQWEALWFMLPDISYGSMFLPARYYYKSGNIRLRFIGTHYLFSSRYLLLINQFPQSIYLTIQITMSMRACVHIYICVCMFLTSLIIFYFHLFARLWK